LFYTYITYNKQNRFQNIGVTSDLKRRLKVLNLQNNAPEKQYKIVYYETYNDSKTATDRENQLQLLSSSVINSLVKENNPLLKDLSKL